MITNLKVSTPTYNLYQLNPGTKFITADSALDIKCEVYIVIDHNLEDGLTNSFFLSKDGIVSYSSDLLVIPVNIVSLELVNTTV